MSKSQKVADINDKKIKMSKWKEKADDDAEESS